VGSGVCGSCLIAPSVTQFSQSQISILKHIHMTLLVERFRALLNVQWREATQRQLTNQTPASRSEMIS
jgi:hypothetical protein